MCALSEVYAREETNRIFGNSFMAPPPWQNIFTPKALPEDNPSSEKLTFQPFVCACVFLASSFQFPVSRYPVQCLCPKIMLSQHADCYPTALRVIQNFDTPPKKSSFQFTFIISHPISCEFVPFPKGSYHLGPHIQVLCSGFLGWFIAVHYFVPVTGSLGCHLSFLWAGLQILLTTINRF